MENHGKRSKIILCSVFMIGIFFTGCGFFKSQNDEKEMSAKEPDNGIKIAIMTSPSGVDDGNFNQSIYEGVLTFEQNNPEVEITAIKEETGDVTAAVGAVADVVVDYDVIVCCGLQFQGIGTLALENPETKFILVDAYPVDEEGNEIEVENIYAMQFREQESGFCAGIAAALETKTGKVAVVNGIAFPSNVNYQYGFESGVNYANKVYGSKAAIVELPSYAGTNVKGEKIDGNYVGNFNDEATGKVIGETLIREGVDILFVAAGASGNGVLTAVKEADNVFYIGCDVNQYKDGITNDGNVVITSAVKIMGRNVEEQLENFKKGIFLGGNVLLGADTYSTGYVKKEGENGLLLETITKIDEAFEKVRIGEIVPASAENQMTPDNFIGL